MQCDLEATFGFLMSLRQVFGGYYVVWGYSVDQQLGYVVSQMRGIGQGPAPAGVAVNPTAQAPMPMQVSAPVSQPSIDHSRRCNRSRGIVDQCTSG